MAEPEMHADEGVIPLLNRGILRLGGPDRAAFLQGLISNDVNRVAPGTAVYACLLTPQGKFLHDFFLAADGESLLIDCEADRREDLARRLRMYKLRSQIDIADATGEFCVVAGLGPLPNAEAALAFADPRIASLGYRLILPLGTDVAALGAPLLPYEIYDRRRIALAVPDGSRDMKVSDAILLENNVDLLSGIAWDKGCYTGQELTARTHYRGLIKKRLVPVRIAGPAPEIGTPIIEDRVEVGEMRSHAGDLGLALVRLERLRQQRPIALGDTQLTPELPPHLAYLTDQAKP